MFGKSSLHPASVAYLDERGDEIVRILREFEPPAVQLHGLADGAFRNIALSKIGMLLSINSTSEAREFDAELRAVGRPEIWTRRPESVGDYRKSRNGEPRLCIDSLPTPVTSSCSIPDSPRFPKSDGGRCLSARSV